MRRFHLPIVWAASLVFLMLNSTAVQAQTPLAPGLPARSFPLEGSSAVPMDIGTMALDLSLNVGATEATGHAVINFQTVESGRPYFLLKAPISDARLNGAPVTVQSVPDPGGENVSVLSASVSPGVLQTLEIEYRLDEEAVGFREGGVGFVTAMADIDNGNFFEAYGPSSFEDDQFRVTLNLKLTGATKPHELFTNGTVTASAGVPPEDSAWAIEFPSYFTTSSFYFHLTSTEFAVRRGTYAGLEKVIPLTVYSQSAEEADAAMEALPLLFAELERDYGPYLHPSFTAYISGAGGMEHDGATITSLVALGHELTHSWFGRGVMPSGGSSGWIDEAIATWRDRDYPRSGALEDLAPANIGNLSPFERFTPFEAYSQGGDFMTVLDNLFAGNQGGLKPVLKEFFSLWKTRLITTEAFQTFLQGKTDTDLGPVFARSILGREAGGTAGGTTPPAEPGEPGVPPPGTLHPPALTPSEVEALR